MRLRRSCAFGFRRKKVDDQAECHRGKSPERRGPRRGISEQMFQHPDTDGKEDEGSYRVTPGSIGPGKFGLAPAQDENTENRERGTKGEAELDVAHGLFESRRP